MEGEADAYRFQYKALAEVAALISSARSQPQEPQGVHQVAVILCTSASDFFRESGQSH